MKGDGFGFDFFRLRLDLLGAMVVQLFLAVVGNAKHKRCIVCTRWFEETRVDKVICSPACKMRLSRQRRAQPPAESAG